MVAKVLASGPITPENVGQVHDTIAMLEQQSKGMKNGKPTLSRHGISVERIKGLLQELRDARSKYTPPSDLPASESAHAPPAPLAPASSSAATSVHSEASEPRGIEHQELPPSPKRQRRPTEKAEQNKVSRRK